MVSTAGKTYRDGKGGGRPFADFLARILPANDYSNCLSTTVAKHKKTYTWKM